MTFELSDEEFAERLEEQTLIGQDYLDAAFGYWLEDHEDQRSPFPESMHDELYDLTFRQFMEWTFQPELEPTADQLSQAFAEIINENGLSLAKTEDERLTIRFAHLPRVGDRVNVGEGDNDGGEAGQGEITKRWLSSDGKELCVNVRFENGAEFETGFELT